ncbi:MAG TPA: hemerythrin domain-containing protein [Usitatibacter sp.]|nr:hemerythrin domain-containing protein [Usitatibacter sp.]
MARARQGSGSLPLALEMLATDHRKVEDLFAMFEAEKEGDDETKRQIAQRICGELTAHAQLEEELFYPWLRENMDEEDKLEEAYVEHASVKDLIAQIEAAGAMDETYDAKVKVLSEYVKHHVKEEENEIFTEVQGMQEELDELGQEMAARKMDLMEQLGLTDESGSQLNAREARERGHSQQAGHRGMR